LNTLNESDGPIGTGASDLTIHQERFVECMYCNKKVSEVFRVTAEDIQREKPPRLDVRVCSDCLSRLRADARLESNYTFRRAILEFSLIVPSVYLALLFFVTISALLSESKYSPSFLLGAATCLTGVIIVWDRAGPRYSYTHNLAWALRSRDVVTALSLVVSGALLATIAPILS
jgi:hypothetical protein